MPPGILDNISYLFDQHSEINGLDFRRSIFIFLTNTGGDEEMTHPIFVATAVFNDFFLLFQVFKFMKSYSNCKKRELLERKRNYITLKMTARWLRTI
jgi:hypothetical protein